MKGLDFITDEKGEKKAVIIDLKIFHDIWEDIHDLLVVESRKNEPRTSWENAKKKIHVSV